MKLFSRTLLLALVTPFLFSACANIGPPEPPSLDLPKPPSDLHATRKGEKIILTWTIPALTTDRQRLRSFGATRICRALQSAMIECGKSTSEVPPPSDLPPPSPPKRAGSYTDTISKSIESTDASRFVTYAVEVLNAAGRGAGLSNQVQVSLARTLPAPREFRAELTASGVVLNWTGESVQPETAALRYLYRVYRRREDAQQEVIAGEISASGGRDFSLTDSSIEWQKTYEYRTESVTLIDGENNVTVQVEGSSTPDLQVTTNDIFPPSVPSGLQAVYSGPGQQPFVDLIWAPVSDMDLEGYNVYRREADGAWIKLNHELVKTAAYRDLAVLSGRQYLYSVSAVDIRGNESARSPEANENVP